MSLVSSKPSDHFKGRTDTIIANYTPGRGKIVPRNVTLLVGENCSANAIYYTPGRGKIVPRNVIKIINLTARRKGLQRF